MKKAIECKCTKCGEVLSVEESLENYKCKYCESEVVVSEAQRFYNAFYKTKTNKLYNENGDFHIVNGILQEYRGNSVFANIPEGVFIIDDNAFINNLSIKKIVVPWTCIQIGEKAFYNCSNLSEIDLPNLIMKIKKETFYNCINLIKIDIPESCTSIGEKAFKNCKSLKYVNHNGYKKLQIIYDEAFRDCYDLEKIAFVPLSIKN